VGASTVLTWELWVQKEEHPNTVMVLGCSSSGYSSRFITQPKKPFTKINTMRSDNPDFGMDEQRELPPNLRQKLGRLERYRDKYDVMPKLR